MSPFSYQEIYGILPFHDRVKVIAEASGQGLELIEQPWMTGSPLCSTQVRPVCICCDEVHCCYQNKHVSDKGTFLNSWSHKNNPNLETWMFRSSLKGHYITSDRILKLVRDNGFSRKKGTSHVTVKINHHSPFERD